MAGQPTAFPLTLSPIKMKHHAPSLAAQQRNPLDLSTLKATADGQRFPLGTTFTPSGRKYPHLCTVTDYLVTTNLKGDIVATRYVATHSVLGQIITNSDVLDTTIARGNPQLPAPEPSW